MYGQISTLAFIGVEARQVDVQVRITPGAHAFAIVGLPDKAVAESRERIRNALHAVCLGLPFKHITVNLAPADLPKEGSHFDLPIALAMMVAMCALSADAVSGFAAIGELALDGSIRAVPGALPAAIGASSLGKGIICPKACGSEASWAGEELKLLAPDNLLSLINHFKGLQTLSRPVPEAAPIDQTQPDLAEIRGQETAKRALEIAAAGGHNMLMVGPPGSGKTMLAARLPSILPPLSPEEILEVSMVQSLAGELSSGRLVPTRPYRAPHHSASMAALVGGGSRPRPGEVSLAHHGVLFLDELPEFQPNTLDALRQPLESGETVIARANHRISYPSSFQLIAAMNPCKCGGAGGGQSCRRSPRCVIDYQFRLSGPFLDRIDMQIEIAAVSAADLVQPNTSESNDDVRARVMAARQRQLQRLTELGPSKLRTNARISGQTLEKTAMPDDAGLTLLRQASESLALSARGFHRTLKVARTIADLDGSETAGRMHVAEALSYRAETLQQRNAA